MVPPASPPERAKALAQNLDGPSGAAIDDLTLQGRRFEWLFHHSPNILAVLTTEGIVLNISDSVEKILGHPPGQLTGKAIYDIVFVEDHATLRERLAGARRDNFDEVYEFHVRDKDGTLHCLEAANSDPRLDAGLTGILLTARDVTKRKELQNQLLRAQRLETIGSLAGGVAHDLNNILAPILMAVELLKRGITDKAKLKMLDTVEMTAQKGRGIVKQILTFARGSTLEQVAVHPDRLIRDAMDVVAQTFPASVLIEQRVREDCWTVEVDITQLHQVLMNLLVNARDAMPEGGRVTFTTENIEVDEAYARMATNMTPGRYVAITVSDTGAGMSAKQLKRIFDPFYTTKDADHGTGLGLATVKQIMTVHGGAISVKSKVGSGTTFRLYLPAQSHPTCTGFDGTGPVTFPFGQGELIIVADDDQSIRDITKQTLESYGYTVRTASNGAEALALLIQEREHARLVLTDFAMPIMDGRQLICAIRKMDLGVKVIVASGTTTTNESTRLVGEDTDAVLAKPFTAGTLLTTVNELLAPTTPPIAVA